MVLFLWAKQLVFNRLPSLRQLTSTDAAGCVKTSFASKQLVFVFHLNFPRMVPFCRRWVQLPAGRHVNMCLTQVWRRVQFTFTSFSIIQFIICVSHPSPTQSSIHFHFLFNYSIRGSYFCVPLNSDTGFNSLSPLKHHLWRGESTQTRNSLMKRVTRVIWELFYEGRLKAGEHFLLDVFTNHHLLTISNSSKRPLFPMTTTYFLFPLNCEKGEQICSQSIIKASGLQE